MRRRRPGLGKHLACVQKTFMNSRRIRMPITHNTPKARVGIVEQCLGLNQVVEGGVVGIVGARLDRDRDGLLVFFVCIILLRVAAAVYFLTHLLVAAAPVVHLASFVTISCVRVLKRSRTLVTSNTTRRVVGQWGGAGGAICEDHFGLAVGVEGRALLDALVDAIGYC